MWQFKPLLDRIGIRVLASITGDGRYNDIAGAHRARVNVVVCSQAMVSLAREMRSRYGMPYIEGSFYGIGNTSDTLRQIAGLLVRLGAPEDLTARADEVVARGEAQAARALEPYRERLRGKRVLLYTGGVKSWSIVSALHELGMTVVGTSVRKSTDEDKDRIRELIGEEAMLAGQIPAKDMYRRLKAGEADLLLSGGRTQFVALKSKTPWLDINQEREHAYAGYDGIAALARRLGAELTSPIWRDVRRPAPWEAEPLQAEPGQAEAPQAAPRQAKPEQAAGAQGAGEVAP
jgi:nitrogenase molybdenum-cofactor synthesis protein NifE